MSEWVQLIGFLVIWYVLMRWVLPRAGVST
jgi:hypothetical protein